jgi:hypothetical protein
MNSRWLPFSLSIHVPEEKFSHKAAHHIALIKAAGGASITCTDGAYVMEDGTLCEETVYIVTAHYDTDTINAVARAVKAYTAYLLASGEEAVLVERMSANAILYTK